MSKDNRVKENQGYCSKCLGLDDESCDCEHCNGTGKEPNNKPEWAGQIYLYVNGKACPNHEAEWFISFISDLLKQQRRELLEKLPKKKKTCGCEKTELGYHTKECTLYPYGWNDCVDKIKAIIKSA